jgi:hypothetical protein
MTLKDGKATPRVEWGAQVEEEHKWRKSVRGHTGEEVVTIGVQRQCRGQREKVLMGSCVVTEKTEKTGREALIMGPLAG